MVNVIVGQNAVGKTKKLMEIYSNSEKSSTICNLDSDRDLTKNVIDIERLNSLAESIDIITEDVVIDNNNTIVAIKMQGCKFSFDFCKVLNLLSKKVRTIILDEPEQGINLYEQVLVYKLLKRIAFCHADLDIWITTHSSVLCDCETFSYYKILEGRMINITQEAANELLDKI